MKHKQFQSIRSSITTSLILLVVCVLAYGLLIPTLGYYWDDWPYAWINHMYGPSGYPDYVALDRPYSAWIFMLLTTILGDVASRVEDLLVAAFKARKYDPKLARMYSQMLVGMVAYTAQWWLGEKQPKQDEVAAQLVNLAWNGLGNLEHDPRLLPPHHESRSAR